jgi:cysteine-rich repeat protein
LTKTGNHICGVMEDLSNEEDCFATLPAGETAVSAPRAYRNGEMPWIPWQGLCLAEGSDRLTDANGVCELQEGVNFRGDCKPHCGDSVLDGDEAATCIHDWLADLRGCGRGAEICTRDERCGNEKCDYIDDANGVYEENACTCPEDCTTADQYWAIKKPNGTCERHPEAPKDKVACPCGNNTCDDHENKITCPEDCPEMGTSTSTTDDMTTGSTTETTDDTSSDTSPPRCDEDPACGPEETVETCPDQCNECGDGVIYGDNEQCDNGVDNQTYWPDKPADDACSDNCDTTFEWCGDATPNGPEACDNGQNLDLPYIPNIPANPSPCTAACTVPRFCGDTIQDLADSEACDDGNNTDGDGCSADCLHVERQVFVSSATYKGDLNQLQNNPQKLTGLALADARCQALATAADLTGNFKAWLSDGATDSPVSRLDTTLHRPLPSSPPRPPNRRRRLVRLRRRAPNAPPPPDRRRRVRRRRLRQELVWTNTLPDGTPASNLTLRHLVL